MAYPTRSDLVKKITQVVLANSPLTTVGPFSALQGLANAVAAVVEDFYRDLQVSLAEAALEGVYAAFDFTPLSPQPAQGTLNLYGTPGAYVPQNTTVSTAGSADQPAVLFQTTSPVYLLAADPTTALSLRQVAGTSSFTAGQTVYVGYAWTSTATSGSTLLSPLASATISANGNALVTSLTLPQGADGLDLYVGTSTSPLQLAHVAPGGAITYVGSATSGLSVTVNASTVTLSITGAAAPDAPSAPVASSAGQASVGIVAVAAGSSGNVGSQQITNIVTSVQGLASVTNPQATTGGTDAETLDSLRTRFATYLQTLSRATPAALESAAMTVAGVSHAKAVAQATFTVYTNQGSVWNDLSDELNRPKGMPVDPLPVVLSVGDAVYFGTDRALTQIYLDVASPGSGLQAAWEYLASDGTWKALPVVLDQTTTGQSSGTLAWSLPSDWAKGQVQGTMAFWFRLRVTSTSVTSVPTWYQVISLDPPPGFVNLYVVTDTSAPDVLAAVRDLIPDWAAAGVTVSVRHANQQPVNVSVSIAATDYGTTVALQQAAANAIANLFAGLDIGQALPLSSIYSAITSLYSGRAVVKVTVTEPATDVLPGPDTLLVAGTIQVVVS